MFEHKLELKCETYYTDYNLEAYLPLRLEQDGWAIFTPPHKSGGEWHVVLWREKEDV